jgi:hypothetical protein
MIEPLGRAETALRAARVVEASRMIPGLCAFEINDIECHDRPRHVLC